MTTTATRRVTDRGLLEICEHEGIVPAPYRDSVGVWTWGIGHTRMAGGPDPAQMPRGMPNDLDAAIDAAIAQFRIDVARYAARVNDAVKVPLEPHEFDALVSFDLNTGGIYRAKLTAALNRGESAAKHFMGWLKPPEIRKRRTAEMKLFESGDYDANGDRIAVWKTNGAGKLTGILTTLSGADLLERMGAPAENDLPLRDEDLDLGPLVMTHEAIQQAHAKLGDALDAQGRLIAAMQDV